MIELVSGVDVTMQGDAVELREDEDSAESAIDAVADSDVDDPVFARERDCGL